MTAPADLELPKGLGLGLWLGLGSGPTCRVEIDHTRPAQSFASTSPARRGSHAPTVPYPTATARKRSLSQEILIDGGHQRRNWKAIRQPVFFVIYGGGNCVMCAQILEVSLFGEEIDGGHKEAKQDGDWVSKQFFMHYMEKT